MEAAQTSTVLVGMVVLEAVVAAVMLVVRGQVIVVVAVVVDSLPLAAEQAAPALSLFVICRMAPSILAPPTPPRLIWRSITLLVTRALSLETLSPLTQIPNPKSQAPKENC